jgi:N-acetylneuraminic acid mutarotase
MKIKLLIIILFTLSLSALGQWTSRAIFPGVARAKATSFTIGDKFYVLGGVTNTAVVLNDFWEYDISLDTWSQKPNFPGPERYGAVSFVIGNSGYVATGGNDFGYLDDLWQYNPVSGNWIQKIGLPNGSAQHENQRTEAFGFVINNKIYLGGGNGFVFGANSTNNIAFYDLWQFDPLSNSWTTKADCPDFTGKNLSIAVAMNGKGYVGLGCNVDQTVNHKNFWEYEPVTDTWTSKAAFPTDFTVDAASFVIDTTIYVVGGVNLNPVGASNQVYKYETGSNTWTQLASYNGGAVAGPFCISTGTRAFIGGGYNSSLVPRNDVWEFGASTTGIDKYALENHALIYPNPATKYISLRSQHSIEMIEAFDLSGKKIFSYKSVSDLIDISNIPDGIYLLKYEFKDGKSGSEKFIKSGQ